jgi:phage terminase Nu1 subunit (DNA packaging protein)
MSDGTFDVQTIASLLQLTPRRLQQLAKEGYIEVDDRGRYPLVGAVRGYIRYLKEHGRETGRGSAHTALAHAQAQKVHMENWRRMGTLQTTAQADETFSGPTVYQRLQNELDAILVLCSDYLEKRADALDAMPDPREGVQAEETADPDGLGEDES